MYTFAAIFYIGTSHLFLVASINVVHEKIK